MTRYDPPSFVDIKLDELPTKPVAIPTAKPSDLDYLSADDMLLELRLLAEDIAASRAEQRVLERRIEQLNMRLGRLRELRTELLRRTRSLRKK